MERGRISTRQAAVLIFLVVVGESILLYPTVLANIAKQDAWIAAFLGLPFGMGQIWIYYRLLLKHPGKTLLEIIEATLGKWGGTLLSVWYLFFFYVTTSALIRETGDFLATQYFTNTPLRAIHMLLIALLLWGIYCGLEVIARTAEILFPLLLLSTLIIWLCLLPQVKAENLLPVFEGGSLPLIHAIMVVVSYPFGQAVVISMILPFVNRQPHLGRDIILSAAMGGALIGMMLLFSLLVLGSFNTESTIYTSYVLAQKINIGNFLQRIEAMLTGAWLISSFFKSVLYSYATALGTAQLFKLKEFRPLIFPIGMILFGLSVLFAPSIQYYLFTFDPYWTLWDLTNGLVLPTLLLLWPARLINRASG
ncbi:endospore germination permease [Gorillibacterium sp. CAU 1737]|uniref:GerAB/ArcD/ProY family transporter n=1 Tax=Gorillibacterium sp. CAU 1737 TaxID=3140362 RepID=UPI0032602167